MKIEDVEIPLITRLEKFLNKHKDEVYQPNELSDIFNSSSDSSIRSALSSLQKQEKIDKLSLGHTKVYYGSPDAIKELDEMIDND